MPDRIIDMTTEPTLTDVMIALKDGFSRMEDRFEHVDRRFEQIDSRFDELESRMERRFDQLEDVVSGLASTVNTHERRIVRLEKRPV